MILPRVSKDLLMQVLSLNRLLLFTCWLNADEVGVALIDPVVLANALFMRSEPAKSTRFMRLVTS